MDGELLAFLRPAFVIAVLIVVVPHTAGATDVAISYRIPMDDLAFQHDGAQETATYRKAVRVLSVDCDVVTADARTVAVGRELETGLGEGRRFLRMGRSVVPEPRRAFRRSGDLIAYVELYGLTDAGRGRSRFTVRTEVSGRGYRGERGAIQRFFDRWFPEERHAVASEVAEYGDAPDTAYWFAIDLRNLAEDNYDLAITVRDEGGGREITRSASFTVLDR